MPFLIGVCSTLNGIAIVLNSSQKKNINIGNLDILSDSLSIACLSVLLINHIPRFNVNSMFQLCNKLSIWFSHYSYSTILLLIYSSFANSEVHYQANTERKIKHIFFFKKIFVILIGINEEYSISIALMVLPLSDLDSIENKHTVSL